MPNSYFPPENSVKPQVAVEDSMFCDPKFEDILKIIKQSESLNYEMRSIIIRMSQKLSNTNNLQDEITHFTNLTEYFAKQIESEEKFLNMVSENFKTTIAAFEIDFLDQNLNFYFELLNSPLKLMNLQTSDSVKLVNCYCYCVINVMSMYFIKNIKINNLAALYNHKNFLSIEYFKRLDFIINKIREAQDILEHSLIVKLLNFIQQHIYLNIGQLNLSKSRNLILMQFDLFEKNETNFMNDKLAQMIYGNMASLSKNLKDTLHWLNRLDDFSLPSPLLVSIRNLLIVTKILESTSLKITKTRMDEFNTKGIHQAIYNSCDVQLQILNSSKTQYSSITYKFLYSTLYALESNLDKKKAKKYATKFISYHAKRNNFLFALDILSVALVTQIGYFLDDSDVQSFGITILTENLQELPLASNSLEVISVNNDNQETISNNYQETISNNYQSESRFENYSPNWENPNFNYNLDLSFDF